MLISWVDHKNKKIFFKAKPADNGVFDHMLLTLEQADTLINKLNSSLEYSHVIPENNKIRNKRAGDLLYFKITPKRQWPIGKAIPYGFDKTLCRFLIKIIFNILSTTANSLYYGPPSIRDSPSIKDSCLV